MISSISSYLTPTGDLILKERQLTTLPKTIITISSSIIQLDLRNNSITHLNSIISSLTHLRSLDLRHNHLETISEDIISLIHLKILRLDNNNLTSLPIELFSLTSLTILTLNRNSVYSLPIQISNLKNLMSLVISSNHLKDVPKELSLLKKLKILYLHGNDFTMVPSSICNLVSVIEFSLEWFRYTVPPLPRVLKNKIGEAIIDSLRTLCNTAMVRGKEEIGIIDFLKHFSEDSFEISRVDMRHRTALHIAVLSGDNGVIQGLVSAGCPLDTLDADGFSAFVLALKENNIKAASLLIENNADLSIGGGCFGSALNLAVLKSEPKLVYKLLSSGLSPNTADFRGNTSLHSLVEVFDKQKHQNTLIGDMLIQHGAELNRENNEKWTPVHLAAKEKQTSALKWMKKKNIILGIERKDGFDFSKQGGAHGWTSLHIASHSGDYNTAEVLINIGTKPSLKNYDGKTPKDTSRGNLALFKYLSRIEKDSYKFRQGKKNDMRFEINKKNHEMSTICEEYKLIYEAFCFKEREELEKLYEESENAIVKSDSVYLVSLFQQKKSSRMLYKAKKSKEILVKNEVIHAMQFMKEFSHGTSRSMTSLKVDRLLAPQASLPNLMEFVEEETRVDTLLMM